MNYDINKQHSLALLQGLLVQVVADDQILMSDNDRCELGRALQVVERLQLDPFEVIADYFETTREAIDEYVAHIDQHNIAFVIPSDEVSTIESIIDIIRGYSWNVDFDKVLCPTLDCLDIRNISIDIDKEGNFYVEVDTKGYMRAIS
jgi:hypothetical protein|tara:strand:- start:60 stop:500 length:441 start_codon:yes stop_codon:yes gene_type:complete